MVTERKPGVAHIDLEQAAAHYEAFLRSFGSILPESDFVASARRATAIMAEWTQAAVAPPPDLSCFTAPPDSGWVAMKAIPFHALCEHHMLPFFGEIDIAILPGQKVAGFSGLVRLVAHLCRRPQLQEGLVVDIADALEEALSPRGVLVRLSARQLCMEMQGRGVGVPCVSVVARGDCRAEVGHAGALAALADPSPPLVSPLTVDDGSDLPPVLLVGAGMAGISCALWLRELSIPFDWIEQGSRLGGSLHHIHGAIQNYVGLSAEHGASFAQAVELQLKQLELKPAQKTLEHIDVATRAVVVDGQRQPASLVVLASGVAPRPLSVSGAHAVRSRTFHSSNLLSRQAAGQRVVVVGGGDGAVEGALILARRGVASVTVLHRGAEFRARDEFLDAAQAHPNINLLTNTVVREVAAAEEAPVLIVVEAGGDQRTLHSDWLLVKTGYAPVLPASDALRCGKDGYPQLDEGARLEDADWVYVIGDAASRKLQTLSHAAARGASAAFDVAERLAALDAVSD